MGKANIITLTDADFDTQVKAHPLLLVDFWADWCGPCRVIAPVLEDLAAEYGGRLVVGKLNVDDNRQTAVRFGVRSIPTLMFFKNGAQTDQVIGAHPKGTLKAKIDQLLNAH